MFITRRGILNFSGLIWDTDAVYLINRMIASGETPTTSRQLAINTCITSLKANSLFGTQFDVLTVQRAHGQKSGLMNWIKNANNALGVTGGGTLYFTTGTTSGGGYSSDGVHSYIDTKYTPTTHGVLYKQNDACWIYKESGTLAAGQYWGWAGGDGLLSYAAADQGVINGAGYNGKRRALGYNCVSRSTSSGFTTYRDDGTYPTTFTSTGIVTGSICIIGYNLVHGAALEVVELNGFGKSMTQNNFDTFKTIMNTYFAAF